MKEDQIPPEVVEAAARAMIESSPSLNWDNMPWFHSIWLKEARDAIAAALAAWPGINHDSQAWRGYGGEVLILPLPPRKKPND